MSRDDRLDNTLNERSKTYGKYEDQASFAQSLKELLRTAQGWANLTLPQRESMEMIATKQARILFGDPDHVDGWHDIAGYSTLIEKILKGEGV